MAKKVKLKISARLLKKRTRRNGTTKKHCRFCSSSEQESMLDYKNGGFLRSFLTARSKIVPSRISGSCTKHQRFLADNIKMSRVMALLPYTAAQY